MYVFFFFQKELLKQEDDIRTAIDIKKNDPYQDELK